MVISKKTKHDKSWHKGGGKGTRMLLVGVGVNSAQPTQEGARDPPLIRDEAISRVAAQPSTACGRSPHFTAAQFSAMPESITR